MRVFVSWSGELSQGVATILHKYLPLMLQGLDVFVSKHDIESGARWGVQLAKELESCDFGILCLTPDNMESRWLLFEAGALTKKMDGRACGLLCGGLTTTDVPPPLAQFQNRTFNDQDFKQLLSDLNRASKKALQQEQVNLVFGKWWPDIKVESDALLKKHVASRTAKHKRTDRDLLEELLTLTRGVAQKFGDDFVSVVPGTSESPAMWHGVNISRLTVQEVNDLVSIAVYQMTIPPDKSLPPELTKKLRAMSGKVIGMAVAGDEDGLSLGNPGLILRACCGANVASS